MPALASFVLTDRETTPVNHTFVPQRVRPDGTSVFAESTGVKIGDNLVQVLARETSDRWVVTYNCVFPSVQTETINGVARPVVVYADYAQTKFSFAKLGNEQARKNVVGMHMSGMDPAHLLNDFLVGLEGAY